jgi:FkbM family methyltransferase
VNLLNGLKNGIRRSARRTILNILYLARLGVADGLRAYYLNQWISPKLGKGELYSVPCGRRQSIMLRGHEPTDVSIFQQIFLLRDVDVNLQSQPRVILDVGAHNGSSTRRLLQKYPAARIVAIEPNKANFDLLQRNTADFTQVTCIQAAVWMDNQGVRFVNPEEDPWAYSVTAFKHNTGDEQNLIRSITMDQVFAETGIAIEDVGLIVMDIEGAEDAIFTNPTPWLSRMRTGATIAIELHEHLIQGCTRAFETAMKTHGFSKVAKTRHNLIVKKD